MLDLNTTYKEVMIGCLVDLSDHRLVSEVLTNVAFLQNSALKFYEAKSNFVLSVSITAILS